MSKKVRILRDQRPLILIIIVMNSIHSWSAKENRLLSLKIGANLKNIGVDTVERYIGGPVEKCQYEKLLIGIPLGFINGTSRAIDGVLAGIADQEIDVAEGPMAEFRRDADLIKGHIVPPRPLKLLTDVIRLPGSFTGGITDAATGFDTKHKIGRLLNESPRARLN